MASLKGSQTEKNLLAAFAGESQARNRYSYYASVARNEGYEGISAIFIETADNEKEHAKVFFKYLEGGMVEIVAEYPAGSIKDTHGNLVAAAEGELLEWGTLYPNFATTADDEGFKQVAASFRKIAEVELCHEKRFKQLAERVELGEVFKRGEPILWKCRNCGLVTESDEAPKLCPACKHPQAHYEPWAQNY